MKQSEEKIRKKPISKKLTPFSVRQNFAKNAFPYFIKEISNICWGYAIDLKFGQDSFVLMK